MNNVSPLGCSPFQRNSDHLKEGRSEETNARVTKCNLLLVLLLPTLEGSLHGSKLVLGDLNKIFEYAILAPSSCGFSNVKDSCCMNQNHNETVSYIENPVPCADQTALWFDPFHPLESTHFLWARHALKDLLVSHPCTLLGLITV